MADYFLHPEVDVYNTLLISGSAQTATEVLTRPERSPTATGTTPNLYITGASGTCILDVVGFFKAPGVTINTVTAYFYRQLRADATITASVLLGGYTKASVVESGFVEDWSSVTWASGDITQQDIHDLRIRFDVTRVTTSPVLYAAYVVVNTTAASVTLPAVADSYTPSVPIKWRPRIKPGAFWI